jgi:hypothetical protein
MSGNDIDHWIAAGLRTLERTKTLDGVTKELLRMLAGVPPSSQGDIDVDDYVLSVRAAAPRALRQEIDAALLRIIGAIADHDPIDDDVAVETLLLAADIFAEHERTDVFALLLRFLSRPRRYPGAVAIAAAQCAIALGYPALPSQWRELHASVGAPAVPTVMGGMARADWQQLGDWIIEQHGDPWVERTYINLLPSFVAVHGTERVRNLVARVTPVISPGGVDEVVHSLARMGITTSATDADQPRRSAMSELEMLIEDYVEDVGNNTPPAEFFGARFAGSANPRREERAFVAELREFLQPWRIEDRNPSPQDARLLRLVSAFTPTGGFDKAVDALHRHIDLGANDALAADIAEAALSVLAKTYHRTPPRAQNDPAFAQCVALLRELADDRIAGPSAIHHLMRLNQVNFQDADFAAAVVKFSETITAAVDAAIEPRSDQHLTWLLNAVVEHNTADGFHILLNRVRHYEPAAVTGLNYIRIPPTEIFVSSENLSAYQKLTLTERLRHHEEYERFLRDATE